MFEVVTAPRNQQARHMQKLRIAPDTHATIVKSEPKDRQAITTPWMSEQKVVLKWSTGGKGREISSTMKEIAYGLLQPILCQRISVGFRTIGS
jgi:hypothetical protein